MHADPQLVQSDFAVAPLGSGEFGAEAGTEEQVFSGTVKWFDVTRGFGFLVADDAEVGDILIHFTVLQEHGRRSLPEGARVECTAVLRQRGLQAREIKSIDLSEAVEAPKRQSDRADRLGLIESAGPFEAIR